MTETFSAQYTVTIGDINYGGHMGNDRPLIIFQDARVQLIDFLGFSETNIGENKGIIMVESGVRYTREVFHQDFLQIKVWVEDLEEKKFIFMYEAIRESDSTLVFSGFTTFLAFDYNLRKVSPLPENFRESLRRFQTEKPEDEG